MRWLPLLLLLCGCGVILGGDHEPVDVLSSPPGATVWSGHDSLGITPFRRDFERDRHYDLTFRKSGHETMTVPLERSVSGGYVLLDILCGVLPLVVDIPNGGLQDIAESVSVQMFPE